jgi:hypothetical protein
VPIMFRARNTSNAFLDMSCVPAFAALSPGIQLGPPPVAGNPGVPGACAPPCMHACAGQLCRIYPAWQEGFARAAMQTATLIWSKGSWRCSGRAPSSSWRRWLRSRANPR